MADSLDTLADHSDYKALLSPLKYRQNTRLTAGYLRMSQVTP